MDRDVLDRHPELVGHVLPGAVRALHRRPDLDLAVGDIDQRRRRLHGDVRHVRLVVLGAEDLGRAGERSFDVALLANYRPGSWAVADISLWYCSVL